MIQRVMLNPPILTGEGVFSETYEVSLFLVNRMLVLPTHMNTPDGLQPVPAPFLITKAWRVFAPFNGGKERIMCADVGIRLNSLNRGSEPIQLEDGL